MIRLVLLSGLALVAGGLLIWLLQADSGYVLIVALGKSIEMRLSVAVLLLLSVAFILWALAKSIRFLLGSLQGGWRRARHRKTRKTEAKTYSGLVHYVEGNWRAAKKDLLKAAQGSNKPLIHYLAAARSAHELGETEQARQLLGEAEKSATNSELAVALSQARLQIQEAQFEQGLATLHRIKTIAPGHPVVLELLQKLYCQLKDWRALEALLPELEKYRVVPAQTLQQRREQAYLGQLDSLLKHWQQEAQQDLDKQTALQDLAELWGRIPKALKKQPHFVVEYGYLLQQLGEDDQAERVVRDALKAQWTPALIDLYGRVAASDSKQQLQQAQSWLKSQPNDARLQLALGRICFRREMWGQAREHLQTSYELQASPESCVELAELLAKMGEHEQSSFYFRRGLHLTTDQFSLAQQLPSQ